MVASSSDPKGPDVNQQADDVRPVADEARADVAAPPLSPEAGSAPRAAAELPFGHFDVSLAPGPAVDAAAPPAAANAVHRLVLLNWWNGLLATLLGLVVSFLLFGFWYPYWRVADMDFAVLYNAFLLNDGLPQEYFDHPGYLSILLLSWWLRLLHALGILHVHALSELPRVSDVAGFAHAWTYATQAGRVLSLLLAIGLVVAFATLLRRLVRDWRVAALGTVMLAYSGGLAMQMRIMRTELLAAGLVTIAFLILLIAAGTERRAFRPLLVGLAAMLAMLAMLNKVQALFLICAWPLLILPFGARAPARDDFWSRPQRAWLAVAASFAAAALLAIPTAQLVAHGLSVMATSSLALQPMFGEGSGLHWLIMAAWIGGGMLAFSIIWRVSWPELLATVAAVLAGGMLGLLILNLHYHPNNAAVVLHPVGWMFRFSTFRFLTETEVPGMVLEAIYEVIARRTFILHTSPRPAIFLEWFVIAATVFALRRGERRLALQAGALMATVWFVDLLGMARGGIKQEYFLFTDPLVIVAAALLIVRLEPLQRHRWAFPVGVALLASHIIISQAEPAKHAYKRGGPEELCGLYAYASKVEQFTFCRR